MNKVFEPTYVRYNGRTDSSVPCTDPSYLVNGGIYLATMEVRYSFQKNYILRGLNAGEFNSEWFDILPTVTPQDPIGNKLPPMIDLTSMEEKRYISIIDMGNNNIREIRIKGGKVYSVVEDGDVLVITKVI